LRVCLFNIVHFGSVASIVRCLNILQGSICALFILQAHVVRVALLQFRLHGLDVQEFGIVELRASQKFTLKPKLLRLVIQNSRLLLESAGLLIHYFAPIPLLLFSLFYRFLTHRYHLLHSPSTPTVLIVFAFKRPPSIIITLLQTISSIYLYNILKAILPSVLLLSVYLNIRSI
jgi:hypothetical protein